jgi:hypothetical protein
MCGAAAFVAPLASRVWAELHALLGGMDSQAHAANANANDNANPGDAASANASGIANARNFNLNIAGGASGELNPGVSVESMRDVLPARGAGETRRYTAPVASLPSLEGIGAGQGVCVCVCVCVFVCLYSVITVSTL